MNDGKGMDIVKNFTCISSEGEPMSPKALGDDLQDYEPQAENANYYQIEDNSVQTQDIWCERRYVKSRQTVALPLRSLQNSFYDIYDTYFTTGRLSFP